VCLCNAGPVIRSAYQVQVLALFFSGPLHPFSSPQISSHALLQRAVLRSLSEISAAQGGADWERNLLLQVWPHSSAHRYTMKRAYAGDRKSLCVR
jgi:hypothetical protein